MNKSTSEKTIYSIFYLTYSAVVFEKYKYYAPI